MEAGRGLPEWGNRGLEVWKLGGLEAWTGTARMRNRRFRRFWADLWACYRTQDCQNRLEITKDSKDTKQAAQGAGRACAQGARPARRPVGAWRASHATLWFWGIQRRQPPSYASYMSYWSYRVVLRAPGDSGAPLRARGEELCKAASAAKPNFQASKLPNFPDCVQDWRGFGIV